MGRFIGFLAGLIAVIAGFGAGLAWLSAHVSPTAVIAAGSALYLGAIIYVVGQMELRGGPALRTYALLVGGTFIAGVLASSAESAGGAALYVYAAAGAIPVFWVAYDLDKKAHKDCPECGESVKESARICRYCRYEFWALPPAATDDSGRSEATPV
jgi:hypothetical protein